MKYLLLVWLIWFVKDNTFPFLQSLWEWISIKTQEVQSLEPGDLSIQ